MGIKLKHFRVAAHKTQIELAEALGVTQPTYQRWESSSVAIPEVKLKKLAKILKTTTEALLGRHPPIQAAFYDDKAPEHLQYYGEVAFHFRSGKESLLLSISEEVRSNLHDLLQSKEKFVAVRDLGNRTVFIRKSAVADLYFSSEAHDDFGPEHKEPGYKQGTPVQIPDIRDWEIIEALAYGIDETDKFAAEHVKRVSKAVMITDDQYSELVADGRIKPEELETEKTKNSAETQKIFEMATDLVYQLSTGERRSVSVIDFDLSEAFDGLEDGMFDDDNFISFHPEGYHRSIFINIEALDYISIPTHILERDRDDSSAKLLDE